MGHAKAVYFMFLLLWLPCLSMRRLGRVEILSLKADVRVEVKAGERGGEKKTSFFLFSRPVPFSTPFGGLLQT